MNESQLEIDFVRWLANKSKDVEARYSRWFEDKEGNCDDGDYCVDCVDDELAARIAAKNPMCEVNGWNEAAESDSQPCCTRCSCLIECSPTRYMIESEIDYLAEIEEMDESSAWSFHNWLSGMGAFEREKDWEKIKPHAWRLMVKDGVRVVPDRFVTYRPAFEDWYAFDSIWLGVYEWYANKLIDWIKDIGKGDLAFLCDTSGVNYSELQPFSYREQPKKCIDKLLSHVGKDDIQGEFLASIGLASRTDMEKPITLPDNRHQWPNLDVRGRELIDGPNECHPKAVVLTNAELYFSVYRRRWIYSAYYDYTHYDRSSWSVDVCQDEDESLQDFLARIDPTMESKLKPDVEFRSHRLKERDRKRSAIKEIFYLPLRGQCDDDVKLADQLIGVTGTSLVGGRIKMTPQRLATLRKWIEDSKETV